MAWVGLPASRARRAGTSGRPRRAYSLDQPGGSFKWFPAPPERDAPDILAGANRRLDEAVLCMV